MNKIMYDSQQGCPHLDASSETTDSKPKNKAD